MSEYAFADIITGKDILTDQVEDKDIIGAKGYFASDLKTIVDSFDDNTFPDSLLEGTVETVSYVGRFKRKEDGIYFDYFIRKKEPEKKYVPFDLSKEEDRDALRGKWVRDSRWGHEWMVEGFFIDEATGAGYKAKLSRKKAGFNGEQLLERYVFLNGSPVGKPANKEEA